MVVGDQQPSIMSNINIDNKFHIAAMPLHESMEETIESPSPTDTLFEDIFEVLKNQLNQETSVINPLSLDPKSDLQEDMFLSPLLSYKIPDFSVKTEPTEIFLDTSVPNVSLNHQSLPGNQSYLNENMTPNHLTLTLQPQDSLSDSIFDEDILSLSCKSDSLKAPLRMYGEGDESVDVSDLYAIQPVYESPQFYDTFNWRDRWVASPWDR